MSRRRRWRVLVLVLVLVLVPVLVLELALLGKKWSYRWRGSAGDALMHAASGQVGLGMLGWEMQRNYQIYGSNKPWA